jgi:transposase
MRVSIVAVRPELDPVLVCEVRTFTAELHRVADRLAQCGVKTVAMESTEVYGIPLYDALRTAASKWCWSTPRR